MRYRVWEEMTVGGVYQVDRKSNSQCETVYVDKPAAVWVGGADLVDVPPGGNLTTWICYHTTLCWQEQEHL